MDYSVTMVGNTERNYSYYHANFSQNSSEEVFRGWILSGYTVRHIIVSSVLLSLIIIAIVFGNVLVIVAIAKDRNLKTIQNWFIASLAVSDLCVGALIMPFSLTNEMMGWWPFGPILCELWLAVDVLLCTASILNLCLISLDRYWSITRVTYVKSRTKKRAVIMVTTVWIMSAIICLPPLIGWKTDQPVTERGGYPMCVLTDSVGYVTYSTMGSFFIPLTVMIVVYFRIYLAARKRARKGVQRAKRPPALDTNSKSTTTTTSFTNRTGIVDRTLPVDDLKESSSEIEHSHNTHDFASDPDSIPDSIPEIPEKTASIPAISYKNKKLEEKRKLLSETETDSDSVKIILNTNTGKSPQLETDGNGVTNAHAQDELMKENHVTRTVPQTDGDTTDDNQKPLLSNNKMMSESDSEKMHCESNGKHAVPHKKSLDSPTESIGEGKHKKGKNNNEHAKLAVLSVGNLRRFSHSEGKNSLKHGKGTSPDKPSKRQQTEAERQKRKLAKARERRATIVLGIIMAVFTLCWLPFFSAYLLATLFHLHLEPMVFAVFFWAGYCNSALNPIIYTIFNRDYRHAFQKLLRGKRRSWQSASPTCACFDGFDISLTVMWNTSVLRMNTLGNYLSLPLSYLFGRNMRLCHKSCVFHHSFNLVIQDVQLLRFAFLSVFFYHQSWFLRCERWESIVLENSHWNIQVDS